MRRCSRSSREHKSCQLTDISVWMKGDNFQMIHELAPPFTGSKISRPAIWITQEVTHKVHLNSVQAWQGWCKYEDNFISSHWLNSTTSRYDNGILGFGIAMRLSLLKTAVTPFRDHDHESRCPFCTEPNPSMKHIMRQCRNHGQMLLMERYNRIRSGVSKAIREDRPDVTV
jgi:hypothetical protein